MLSNLTVNLPQHKNNPGASRIAEEIVFHESLMNVKSLTDLQTVTSDILIEESKEKSFSIRVTCKVCFDYFKYYASSTRYVRNNLINGIIIIVIFET